MKHHNQILVVVIVCGFVSMPRILHAQRVIEEWSDSLEFKYLIGNCKFRFFDLHSNVRAQYVNVKTNSSASPLSKVPFISVHGNIQYELAYRSYIDTPYAEKDIYQHTVQVALDINYKGYPIRVQFSTRASNSALFRNFSDLGFGFTPISFSNNIKDRLKERVSKFITPDSLLKTRNKLENVFNQFMLAKNMLESSATKQKLVEQKEHELYGGSSNGININPQPPTFLWNTRFKNQQNAYSDDNVMLDTTDSQLPSYDSLKKLVDTLSKKLNDAQKDYELGKQMVIDSKQKLVNQIEQIRSKAALKNMMRKLDMPDSTLPKGYSFLSSIRSFSLGRTILDHTELSARNLSITGIHLEFNPNSYWAVAAGSINYRFRDYTVQLPETPRQYIFLASIGKGLRDGNNIIATFYNGSRQLYNYAASVRYGVDQRLMGYTVEGTWKPNSLTTITGEIAKSSLPYYSPNAISGKYTSTIFRWNDRSNEAYSIKLATLLEATNTTIQASYKRIGENFQSFSVFTTGSSQTAWNIRLSQPFFNRKLTLTTSLRTNGFANPYITNGYSSSTVFKSIQATFRKRGLPIISLGYFPSSQLTKLEGLSYIENLFYTLTATMSHTYSTHKHMMSSIVTYTRFYNSSNDTGFVYYNSTNLMANQVLYINKFVLQATIAIATNNSYNLYTGEGSCQYQLNNHFSLGAGCKYNWQTIYNRQLLGYTATATYSFKNVGSIQLFADRGFLPSLGNKLIANTTGRLVYIKTF